MKIPAKFSRRVISERYFNVGQVFDSKINRCVERELLAGTFYKGYGGGGEWGIVRTIEGLHKQGDNFGGVELLLGITDIGL